MASKRLQLGGYVGLLLLIVPSRLFLVSCLASPTSTTGTPSAVKCTKILNRTFSNNSYEFSKVSPSTTTIYISTGTRILKIVNGTRKLGSSDGCLKEHSGVTYPRFVDKYSSFYLKIGGWLMLGIVFAGITALVVTHVLGMRNMRRPRRRQLSRILWVEALTKSKLARFV